MVFLRAYAQKQPINEYKREAFGLFEKMLEQIREDVTRVLSTSQLQFQPPPSLPDLPDFLTGHVGPLIGDDANALPMVGSDAMLATLGTQAAPTAGGMDPFASMGLSRNATCPCGSGKKYKHCHGAAG